MAYFQLRVGHFLLFFYLQWSQFVNRNRLIIKGKEDSVLPSATNFAFAQ